MQTKATCTKCGSDEIFDDAELAVRGAKGLWVAIPTKPDALVLKGYQLSELRGVVCVQCGFVEFFAGNLENLRFAYEKRRSKRG